MRRPRTGLARLDSGGLRDSTWAPTYERPARSWLTSGRKWPDEKRGPRTEIAAVECREARRYGPAISGESEIGPTARRATRCGGSRTSAVSALRSPRLFEGELPQASGADASRERGGLSEIFNRDAGAKRAGTKRVRAFEFTAKLCLRMASRHCGRRGEMTVMIALLPIPNLRSKTR